MAHEVATATKCAICGKVFYGPAKALGGIVVVGEAPGPRFFRFLDELFEHLSKDHPQVFKVADVYSKEYQGWLLLANFSTLDKEVLDQRNYFRWRTHQATLQCRAKNLDATANEIAKAFLFWMRSAETIADVVKGERADDLVETIAESWLTMRILVALQELQGLLEEPNAYPTPPEEEKWPIPTANGMIG